MRESESLMVNVRAKITDEALVVEASKYDSSPSNLVGVWDILFSTPSFGYDQALVLGESSGLGRLDTVEGVGFQALLSVILATGSSWVMETKGEKSLVKIGVGGEVERPALGEPP